MKGLEKPANYVTTLVQFMKNRSEVGIAIGEYNLASGTNVLSSLFSIEHDVNNSKKIIQHLTL